MNKASSERLVSVEVPFVREWSVGERLLTVPTLRRLGSAGEESKAARERNARFLIYSSASKV